jgi:hypothetical protein
VRNHTNEIQASSERPPGLVKSGVATVWAAAFRWKAVRCKGRVLRFTA